MLRKYPAVFILPFVVLGIVSADLLRPESGWLFAACLATCLGGLLVWKSRPQTAMIILVSSLALYAGFRFATTVYDHGPDALSDRFESGKYYVVFGTVADWPVMKNLRTEIMLSVDSLSYNERSISCRGGLLMKVTDQTTALQRGDRVVLSTRVYRPRGGESLTGFDYNRFLHLRGIEAVAYLDNLLDVKVDRTPRSKLYLAVHQVRQAILSTFRRYLSPDAAALASGFLIGETRDVPPSIYNMFRDSGTLHLLAVSGSNVALIVLFIIVLLRPLHLPRQVRAVLLWITILFFCWLSYAEPSVVRASLMASLVILAQVLQRRYDLNNVVAVTALIILLVEPAQLYSVGFQLSFATAWGLILVLSDFSPSTRGFLRHRWARWWLFLMLATITAQLFSAPLSAFYFERIPLISPLANLLIVPAVSLAVLGSALLLLTETLLPWASGWVGFGLDALLRLIMLLLEWFGGDGLAVWRLTQPSLATILGAYAVLVLGALSIRLSALRRSAVIFGVIAVNVWLGFWTVRDLKTPDAQYLDIIAIPGGTAVIVRVAGSGTADLFVSNAQDRNYSLAESVLNPQLQASGVRRLRCFSIADADFGALSDLLTTARSFGADTVWLPGTLRASSLDIVRLQGWDDQAPKLLYFDSDSTAQLGRLTVDEGAIGLNFRQASILIKQRVLPSEISPPEGTFSVLVTGRLTNTEAAALGERADMVICSRIEHGPDSWTQSSGPLDLSLTGAVRVVVPTDSTRTPTFKYDLSDYH